MEEKTSVEILTYTLNPLDPSILVLTCAVDLSQPGQLAGDFRKALRNVPGVPARAIDPKLFLAVRLVQQKGLSIRKASELAYGHPRKKSAVCRLLAAINNAAAANEKH
jgi:hypothetical protein